MSLNEDHFEKIKAGAKKAVDVIFLAIFSSSPPVVCYFALPVILLVFVPTHNRTLFVLCLFYLGRLIYLISLVNFG